MASTDLIAPIIVAIISLVGSFLSVLLSWHIQKKQNKSNEDLQNIKRESDAELVTLKGESDAKLQNIKRDSDAELLTLKRESDAELLTLKRESDAKLQTLKEESDKNLRDFQAKLDKSMEELKMELTRKETEFTLMEKYGPPLMIAAYDLQQRLFELVEYPISRQHLEKLEGLEDLKIFTCFLLARYLVTVHIMRTNTGYFSFSTETEMQQLRTLMYVIDEELDRRRTRDPDSQNIGVWPAARILIGERMIIDKREVNNALDGGFGFNIKGFDLFRKEWDTQFKEPMAYFCETIDMAVRGRMEDVPWSDCALRVLQHLLVDLVKRLDTKRAYVTANSDDMKCEKSVRGCDCDSSNCGNSGKIKETLRDRQNSRWGDPGIWTYWGLGRAKKGRNIRRYYPELLPTMDGVEASTHKLDLD